MDRRAFSLALLAALPWPAQSAPGSVHDLGLSFVDDEGRACGLAQWRGRALVVAMGYGACRKICSTTLRTMERVHDAAHARGLALQFVMVSIDPAQDTPQDWHAYRASRGLAGAEWSFLVGSRAATRRLADFLGVRYWTYDDHVMHDFKVLRLDGEGRIAATLAWSDERPERLLDGLAG